MRGIGRRIVEAIASSEGEGWRMIAEFGCGLQANWDALIQVTTVQLLEDIGNEGPVALSYCSGTLIAPNRGEAP